MRGMVSLAPTQAAPVRLEALTAADGMPPEMPRSPVTLSGVHPGAAATAPPLRLTASFTLHRDLTLRGELHAEWAAVAR